jgi:hypothetical protein
VGDYYELVLTIDIRPDIPADELAELRWHMGQEPRPEQLLSVPEDCLDIYPLGDPNDPDCEWETAEPEPMFAQRGAAWAVGGALVAELVRRERPDGWSLTARQEVDPNDSLRLSALLEWLGPRSIYAQTDGIPFFVGYQRFYESNEIEPLILLDGRIRLPWDTESRSLDPRST